MKKVVAVNGGWEEGGVPESRESPGLLTRSQAAAGLEPLPNPGGGVSALR